MTGPAFDIGQLMMWWNAERTGHLTEIRLISPDGKTYSGYYKNFDNIVRDISLHPECNVYATINNLNEAVYGRQQNETLVPRPKNSTSDNDVLGRNIVVVDIDACRPAGVNATDEELGYALATARKVFQYLVDQGFSRPAVSFSGNGYHLRLKTLMACDKSETTIKDFLLALDSMFSDDHAAVDTSVYNPARILKVPGTPSRKGSDIPERPQRMSRYLYVPDDWAPTPREYFEKVASIRAVAEQPSRDNNYRDSSRFDLRAFMAKHGIKVQREVATPTGTRFILEHCVFDPQHKAPDAMIFQANDGAIGYFCFHQSCSTHRWRDVRLLFEPEAYTRAAQAEFLQRREYYATRRRFEPLEETAERGKKWMTASDIRYDPKAAPSIPTGYYPLDRKTGGMVLGDVTVISGKPSSGKSIWLDSILLNVVSRGYTAAVWSGELQPSRFMGWLAQVAAGKSYVQKVDGYDNYYRCPKPIAERIFAWLDKKIWLYSSEQYSNSWAQLLTDMRGVRKLHPEIKLFVVDNLSALDIDEYEGTIWEKQKQFVVDLKKFAKEENVHVILIVHPRKTKEIMRREDISGDSNLANLVDTVLLVHRVGEDFKKCAAQFFPKNVVPGLLSYDTVIEVAKNRVNGVEDFLLGLYYEPESKRLKCEPADNIQYPWQEPEPEPEPAMAYAPPPDPDPYADDPFGDSNDNAPF